ncbi:MAG: acyltransferase [Pelagibacteraceae bacterium]|mgnify:FL=1|jgi:putative hemolysin|nr:acyltransferase [Pelagibacteraceae bacterium]MBT4645444.1 acyltransferase [Pelagibacteraceae bacterium]MBT4950979.1 acyltransferase [Pelagibacteraceae bacterium]MBT5213051.1 acyltransferase [Pelagibacteraceae bacterium]
MKIKSHSNIAFTFATSEVNVLSQQFIKIIELLTGKLKLKKMYDEYVLEDNPPENFWIDAVKKLNFKLQTNYQDGSFIPTKGRLIIVANHAFGVADGVSLCSVVSNIRQDYKIITHKVLRQANAVKDKIIPIDFSPNKEAILANIASRKEAEKVLKEDGVIILFPSGQIATKENLKFNTKAHDGEWKQFVSKLIIKTKSPALPSYFEGENSQLYHFANKMGQTFRYSLLMHELIRKIGDTIYLHFGEVIPFSDFENIGNLIEITQFLRKKTYSLDPMPVYNNY